MNEPSINGEPTHGKKRPPFSWADKRALRKIRESIDDAKELASALSTYLALTEAASNEASDVFRTTQQNLAGLSGFSVSTVARRLEFLARIGAVSIVTPPLKAPSTYTLHAIGHDGGTFSRDVRTLRRDAGTPCHEDSAAMTDIRRTESNLSLQLPPGDHPPSIPATVEEAQAMAASVGASAEFIASTWNLAMSRGGRDSGDRPIRNWPCYVAFAWQASKERTAELRTRKSPGVRRKGYQPPEAGAAF